MIIVISVVVFALFYVAGLYGMQAYVLYRAKRDHIQMLGGVMRVEMSKHKSQ